MEYDSVEALLLGANLKLYSLLNIFGYVRDYPGIENNSTSLIKEDGSGRYMPR